MHLIGNGKSASLFDHNSKGLRFVCNLPPFAIENIYATFMVDWKMQGAIAEGSLQVPGDWILGYRPRVFCDKYPAYFMRHAHHIKDFYTVLPSYVENYTDFNCGHMGCHYISAKLKPDVIHMYGFNSIFDFDLFSCSDLYLYSNREAGNNLRLSNKWRKIWPNIFEEFPNITYKLYGKHNHLKLDRIPSNVEIVVK